jgi:uncharacterized membrane protein
MTQDTTAQQAPRTRLRALDALRGFSVLSMVLFHAAYDVAYVYQAGFEWFRPPLQDVWRASISWTFLLIAGVMCNYSRDNLKRSGRYLLVAALIFVATSVAKVDVPISFGIIFCMGASTLLYALLERLGLTGKREGGGDGVDLCLAALLFVAFLATLKLPQGLLGLGPWQVMVPRGPYDSGMLDWAGFPSPTFASGDYYPVIPFSLLYLAGSHLGRVLLRHEGIRSWLETHGCPPLEWVGRHALWIYVLHQPLLVGVFTLLFQR